MNHGFEPMQFVRAKGGDAIQQRKRLHDDGLPQKNEEEAGREAREFYESIIASTSSHPSSPALKNDGEKALKDRQAGRREKPRKKHATKRKERRENQAKDVDSQERNSGRSLHELLRHCQEGNLSEVKRIIRREGSGCLRDCDHYGWNALMCAACSGHADIAAYILGRDPLLLEHRNNKGQTTLELAQKSGQRKVVRLLQDFERTSVDPHQTRSRSRLDDDHEGRPGPTQPFWCEVCEAEFRDRKRVHRQSTAHLFSCGHAPNLTLYHIPESNRGFQMMLQDGWDKESGLGKGGEGRKFPVKTILKRDRQGLGVADDDCRPRVTHFKPFDKNAVKYHKKKKLVKEKDNKKVQDGSSSAKRKEQSSSESKRQKTMEIDFRRSFNMY